jgi:hypothetical protein
MTGTGVGLCLNQPYSSSALTDQRLSLPIVAGVPCANAAPVAADTNNPTSATRLIFVALTVNTGTRAIA